MSGADKTLEEEVVGINGERTMGLRQHLEPPLVPLPALQNGAAKLPRMLKRGWLCVHRDAGTYGQHHVPVYFRKQNRTSVKSIRINNRMRIFTGKPSTGWGRRAQVGGQGG